MGLVLLYFLTFGGESDLVHNVLYVRCTNFGLLFFNAIRTCPH